MKSSKKSTMAIDPHNTRLTITISKYNYKKLLHWAKIHGKQPTAFAGQIISSRLEANTSLIKEQVADMAKSENISVEELEERWQEEDNKL
ncbi:MAG: hypothetical protein HC815_06035 [Richelia sp. RM1_1_1]|nr:hypothetical protein [Richelia sp. RM1_1_1]